MSGKEPTQSLCCTCTNDCKQYDIAVVLACPNYKKSSIKRELPKIKDDETAAKRKPLVVETERKGLATRKPI